MGKRDKTENDRSRSKKVWVEGEERKAKKPLLLLHHGFFAPMCKIKRPHVRLQNTKMKPTYVYTQPVFPAIGLNDAINPNSIKRK